MTTLRSGSARHRSESGSGMLSTVFGVMVFLALMLFTGHLILNLWLMSSVDAVAHDAATDVATSGADGVHITEVQQKALSNARAALGGYGGRVKLEFEDDPTGHAVVLHVSAPELTLLPRIADGLVANTGLDRRITVERELPDTPKP